MDKIKAAAALEAILYVAGDPVDIEVLKQALELTDMELAAAAEQLSDTYEAEGRGLKLLQFSDKLQLCTKPELANAVERALSPIQKQTLTGTLLETLSVIAYKQPITKQEVENIRGIHCDYSVSALTKLGLICEAGRKDALGRPILYKTTDEFLRYFGLASLDDLPRLGTSDETGGNFGSAV